MVRGLLSELIADASIDRAACLAGANDVAGTSAPDPAIPGPGEAFYSLVRGENSCVGPYGTDSEGTDRVLPPSDCP